MKQEKIITINSENISDAGIFCIKNKTSLGSQAKIEWCRSSSNKYLRIKIVVDSHNKQIGFIEYTPSEFAWRPIEADNYLFIQCIAVFVKQARSRNIGLALIQECEQEAKHLNKLGVCVMTSDGAWMANKKLFKKNGYHKIDELDRFELMAKKFDSESPSPRLINWKEQQKQYKGWNLIYADQCPWHQKSVSDLKELASEYAIDLKIKKIKNSSEAKKAPSGFGVYSLIRDGKLIEDHYLSKTRFENILKEELRKK